MRTKYEVMRHYNVIFTGTLNQVKRFLISIPEFANYEKQIRRAKYGDGKCGAGWSKSLDEVCCITEYCCIRIVDRRKNAKVILEAQSEAQYEVLNAMIDNRKKALGL